MAGYNMTACSQQLVCAPMKSGKLVGTGIGFCNLTAPGQSVSPCAMAASHIHGTSILLHLYCPCRVPDCYIVGARIRADWELCYA